MIIIIIIVFLLSSILFPCVSPFSLSFLFCLSPHLSPFSIPPYFSFSGLPSLFPILSVSLFLVLYFFVFIIFFFSASVHLFSFSFSSSLNILLLSHLRFFPVFKLFSCCSPSCLFPLFYFNIFRTSCFPLRVFVVPFILLIHIVVLSESERSNISVCDINNRTSSQEVLLVASTPVQLSAVGTVIRAYWNLS
jgi:hypothetical protein